ncbi:unnamed protein product [Peronospora destructor]|uniref:PAP-associated domain-containing protein n=1 Tax=Peronospora destructor TaxID=86335 RepID=A0AAV0UE06_9STRA|nr:unnamed protein product [Peronospora destructor]
MEASKLVRQYVNDLPRLKPLLIVLRRTLREKALNSAYTGGLSSYAVTLLAVFMMEIQRHQEPESDSENEYKEDGRREKETSEEREARKLGQLLLDFWIITELRLIILRQDFHSNPKHLARIRLQHTYRLPMACHSCRNSGGIGEWVFCVVVSSTDAVCSDSIVPIAALVRPPCNLPFCHGVDDQIGNARSG